MGATGKNAWFMAGGLVAAAAVAAGAFGAHGLRSMVEQGTLSTRQFEVFETAARYQMFSAIGLCLVGLLQEKRARRRASWSGWAFVGGLLGFSGSLYGFALTGAKVLGMIAPLGGTCMIVAWVLLAVAGASGRTENSA